MFVSKIIWAKPHRKDYQLKSYWHMEKFFRELAKRLNISLKEARLIPQKMIFDYLKNNKKILSEKIKSYFEFHLCLANQKGIKVLRGKTAKNFSKNIWEEKIKINKNILFGSPCYPGKAKGKVSMVNSTDDILKMEKGNILVSVATTPSIVTAIRKATAILTDGGGLTLPCGNCFSRTKNSLHCWPENDNLGSQRRRFCRS
jgi:hypothetical protein